MTRHRRRLVEGVSQWAWQKYLCVITEEARADTGQREVAAKVDKISVSGDPNSIYNIQ